MRDHDVAEEKAKDRLHVGHVNRSHHTRHRHERHARKGGTYHADGDNIPRRLSVAQEKGLIAVVAPCDPCNEQEQPEIGGDDGQDEITVHECFLGTKIQFFF